MEPAFALVKEDTSAAVPQPGHWGVLTALQVGYSAFAAARLGTGPKGLADLVVLPLAVEEGVFEEVGVPVAVEEAVAVAEDEVEKGKGVGLAEEVP